MIKKNKYLFIPILILLFLLSSCLLAPPLNQVNHGSLKGQVMVPVNTPLTKEISGESLPNAIVKVIDPDTKNVIATTSTDDDGYYQVLVPPGGPYLLEVTKEEILICQITPEVEAGEEYDLGITDCLTTTVALIAQAMVIAEDYPDDFTEMNLTTIETDPDFSAIMMLVCNTIQSDLDPTQSPDVTQAIEDFLHPPTPDPGPSSPTTPSYKVTFDSQGGTAVSSQNVKKGQKATEPTDPTREGYTFEGWYKEASCLNLWDFSSDTVTSDTTLYAKWIANTYYVTLYVNPSGAGFTSGHNPYQTDEPVKIEASAESCYKFMYWTDIDQDNSIVSSDNPYSFTMPPKDVNYTANFAPRIYNVDTGVDYNTIQDAINDANDENEETIIVCPGTYYENILFDDIKITVKSSNPTDPTIVESTIIDGGGSGSVVTFTEGNLSTLEGFTIQNGDATDGGGILIAGSSPIIKNNHVKYNIATSFGGGIYVSGSSQPTIEDNIIAHNTATTLCGGGIALWNTETSFNITDNVIEFNQSLNISNGLGGGMYIRDSYPALNENTIQENEAIEGGGIFTYISESTTFTLTITENIINNNSADKNGGGMNLYSSDSLAIMDNEIKNNSVGSGYNGGGIYINNSLPTIGSSIEDDKNSICGNHEDGSDPILDQQIYDSSSGSLYEDYKDTNHISANCE